MPEETKCKCGCGMDIVPELREYLNQLRKLYNGRITVVSGARCYTYNKKVGGAKHSMHMEGKAADLKLPSRAYDRDALLYNSLKLPFWGRGFYKTFIHLDIRPEGRAAYWVR